MYTVFKTVQNSDREIKKVHVCRNNEEIGEKSRMIAKTDKVNHD